MLVVFKQNGIGKKCTELPQMSNTLQYFISTFQLSRKKFYLFLMMACVTLKLCYLEQFLESTGLVNQGS